MRFIYKNSAGRVREVRLLPWEETGLYIEGYCLDTLQYKSFLKFRVIEYLEGSESLLREPYPSAAEIDEHISQLKAKTVPKDKKIEVCFTGFPAAQKLALQNKAIKQGMHVVTDVTVNLKFLVAGPTRGPSKVKKARAKGLLILLEHEFHDLLETGELPDGDSDIF